MTASAATSVALLTHSAHPKEGNCSMFCVRGSCKCLSAGLYRFLLRPFLLRLRLHLLLYLSAQHLLRGVSLFVCLSIVWIALTCEALGQYLCTTLCQCAKCRRRRSLRRRWSCRCRRVLSPARSLSPELCLVCWVASNIALLMSNSWMEEQLQLCLVARKVSWSDHSTPSWRNVNNVKLFDDVLWSHDGIFRQSKCVENIPKNRRFFNDMQLAGKWKVIAEDSPDW